MLRTRIILGISVVALTLTACGGGGAASSPTSPSAAANESTAGDAPLGSITVTEESAAAQEVLIGPDGGAITAAAADGTTFVLTIPAGALPTETSIRAVPATLEGVDFPTYTVMFGPTGTQFTDWVSLAITPPTEIPVPDQFVYQLNDDASAFGAAFIDPAAKAPTILLDHFSGYGLARATEPERAALLSKGANEAEARIQSEFATLLGKERQAQLLGGESDTTIGDSFETFSKEYEEQVIKPRLEAAGGSCEATREAVRTVLGYERQRQLLGVEGSSTIDAAQILQDATSTSGGPCEEEAIAKCKAAKDPGILIAYWLEIERSRQLLGSEGAGYDVNSLIKKARGICAPSAYQADGQLPSAPAGITMTGLICSLSEPFSVRLTGDLIGRMKFTPSSDEAGTWVFKGRVGNAPFSSKGSGDYTVAADETGLATALDFVFENTITTPLGSRSGSGPGQITLAATAPCAEQQ